MEINQETRDLYELNLAYLMMLRERARKDIGDAAVRFGIDQTLAQSFADSSLEQLRAMANPSLMQVKMRSPQQMRSLIRDNSDNTSRLLSTISMLSEGADNE